MHLIGYDTEDLTADQLRADVDVLTEGLRSGDVEPPPFERLPLADAAGRIAGWKGAIIAAASSSFQGESPEALRGLHRSR